jgi:hypothetical protein
LVWSAFLSLLYVALLLIRLALLAMQKPCFEPMFPAEYGSQFCLQDGRCPRYFRHFSLRGETAKVKRCARLSRALRLSLIVYPLSMGSSRFSGSKAGGTPRH